PRLGMATVVGPVNISEPRMELLFHPWHPRPSDCPDGFTFEWELTPVEAGGASLSGIVDADCESYRRNPEAPPIAHAALGGFRGRYWITIRPQGLSDFPDIEIYLIQLSA